MTPATFRRVALSFPGAVEGEHMGHPDFRVGGRIFASLSGGAEGEERGMVKVMLEEQEALVSAHPDVFEPCAGAWGRQGCTAVRLEGARVATLEPAMAASWRGAAEKGKGRAKREGEGGRTAKK